MRVIVAAGGTGGHIFPAVAIVKELQKYNAEILFIGNKDSMESTIVLKNKINFIDIDVQKLYRKFTFKHFIFPFKLLNSIIKSIKIMKRFKPNFFLGTGGFVSGAPAIAAILLKIPIFLEEQNSYPGLTNRKLQSYAKAVFLGMPGAEKYFSKKKYNCGIPIEKPIIFSDKKKLYNKYDFDENKKTIIVYCGSQGSAIINKIIHKSLDELLKFYNVIWQTGKNDYKKYYNLNMKNLFLFDFTFDKYEFLTLADYAVTRAGALTLAELETMKIFSIMIPLPNSAGNHQLFNALDVEKRGFGVVLEQNNLSKDYLLNKINDISNNLEKKELTISKHVDAAKLIVRTIFEELK